MSFSQGQNSFEQVNTDFYCKSVETMAKIEQQKQAKYEQFKERIAEFANISTIEEAKTLSKKILPVSQDINKFNVGTGTCTIINRSDLFRISLNSDKEFISYDFV